MRFLSVLLLAAGLLLIWQQRELTSLRAPLTGVDPLPEGPALRRTSPISESNRLTSTSLDGEAARLESEVRALQAQIATLRAAESDSSIKSERPAPLLSRDESFLLENKNKPGVVTLESGLQYLVLQQGTGPHPSSNAIVTVHFQGKRVDGSEFDNSLTRGKPMTLPLQGVIKGWAEGIQLMPEGSKFQLFVPADLGYGKSGVAGSVPGGATLIFDVELLSVQEPVLRAP